MKISKLFHWLYALVMFLPVLFMPVFMIYTRNENSTFNDSITIEENSVVNFNQLYDVDLSISNADYSFVGENQYFDCTFNASSYVEAFYLNYDLIENHKYYLAVNDFHYSTSAAVPIRYLISTPGNISYNQSTYHNIFTYPYNASRFTLMLDARDVYYTGGYPVRISGYFNLFDLTLMFGAGNEPTYQQFDIWYPNNYYSYDAGSKQLLKNYNSVTYSDTDIGSQFMYSSYNYVNKYFNYDKVFNFSSLYDWLQLTYFNGNATLGFFVFWHLLIYWLLTSLIWLIFDVLMYVPLLIHRWLDKAALS